MHESTKVTNEKTGDNVTVDKNYSRSHHKQKELAIKILRSRQWARENGYGPNINVVANYENPDDDLYPNHQLSFRNSNILN